MHIWMLQTFIIIIIIIFVLIQAYAILKVLNSEFILFYFMILMYA